MHRLGLSVMGCQLNRNSEGFIRTLDYIQKTGFKAIELSPEDFDAINYGKLDEDVTDKLQNILKQFSFDISVHVPLPLNLFNLEYPEIHERVLYACLQFSRIIGAKILVYHPGRYIDNIEFTRYGKPDLDMIDVNQLKKLERLILQNASDVFSDITIVMENHRPYIYHSPYSYAEHIEFLVEQVQSINRNNVGYMIDTGHLLLSSKYYNYDIFEKIKKINYLPCHFHINDNHGICTYYTEKDKKGQHVLGRGDEHIIPGEGIFPFKSFLKMFTGYKGNYIVELTDRLFYEDNIKKSFDRLKSFLL